MNERTAWPDTALDREFQRVYRTINGLPRDVVRLEEAVKALGGQVQELVNENEQLRAELRGDRWSRSQIIGAIAVVVSFAGSTAATLAVLLG